MEVKQVFDQHTGERYVLLYPKDLAPLNKEVIVIVSEMDDFPNHISFTIRRGESGKTAVFSREECETLIETIQSFLGE